MLVKIEDGFYLNTVHIIAIRIAKSAELGTFQVNVEYIAKFLIIYHNRSYGILNRF